MPERTNEERPDLTEPERRLWSAYSRGTWVDLGDRDCDPAEGPDWGPERTVRAEVIAELLLGAREAAPGHVAALRLGGARIIGRLQLSGGRVDSMLRLSRCHLEQPIFLTEAETRRVRITDCYLPGVEATGLRVDGYLSLSGCTITGPVRLARASLSNGLNLIGTRITSTGDWAFTAGALSVGGGTLARGAEITGGMRMTGARMGGGLFLEGARLRSTRRFALLGDNMEVEDLMECSQGFSAEGEIRLRAARINGTLSFDKATLRGHPGGRALTLSMMTAQELILSPSTRIEAPVHLTQASVGQLIGEPRMWPDRLHLSGFVYNSLRPHEVPVKERIGMLSRHPDGFRPQPYEQLADWYRRNGREDLARRTLLAKQRSRRPTLWPGGKIASYLLDLTVGYGYRPWMASMWLAVLLTAGTVVFSAVHPHPLKQPAERPGFHAFVYTLDLLIPIGSLGQRDLWEPVGWTRWLAYGLIAGGWILATALIAGVTRILRPT